MGYATALNIPVFALRTDFRKVGTHEQVNLMLEQSAIVVKNRGELLVHLKSPRLVNNKG
jgi:nucleoside 2-deoxyribosyltransferase